MADLEADDRDVEREEQKGRGVGPARPEQTLAPFPLPDDRGALFAPDLRREVQLHVAGGASVPIRSGRWAKTRSIVSRKARQFSSSSTVGKDVSIPCSSALRASCGRSRSNCFGLGRVERAGETEFAVLADRRDELFAFPINDQRAPAGGMRGGALRGIDRHLARNVSASQERPGEFREPRDCGPRPTR